MSSKCMIALASTKPTIMSEVHKYDPKVDTFLLVRDGYPHQ